MVTLIRLLICVSCLNKEIITLTQGIPITEFPLSIFSQEETNSEMAKPIEQGGYLILKK